MCGFAGIISKNSDSLSKVEKMSSMIKHRGPDSKGSYVDESIAMSFRRLSIIDLSEMGSQPMKINEYVITFNGEIYNYKDLRKLLEQNGFNFKSTSDTEVLLNSYIFWGKDMLTKIKGMFAFAIWDTKKKKLFMARDHFGKKPFYYSNNGNDFIFCSEINPIHKTLDSKSNIDQTSLINYLMKGYYNRSKTIYKNIFTLDAGEYAVYDFKSNFLSVNSYWKNQFNLTYSEANVESDIQNTNQALNIAIQRRYESDVPVGIALSGGIDSSLIAVKSAEIIENKIDTYSISFSDTKYDEYEYVDQLLNENPQLRSVRINQGQIDLKNTIDNLVNCFGEPFGDDSAIPSFALYNELKNYGKVFLTGDGADEIFGGYVDYKIFLMQDNIKYINGISNFISDNFLFKTILFDKKYKKLAYFIKMLKSDNQLFNFLRTGGWSSSSFNFFEKGNISFYNDLLETENEEAKEFEKLGNNYISRYLNKNLERLTQQFLVKSDRTSMFNSVELRSPFLDIDISEITKNSSVNSLFYKNKSKYILKNLMTGYMNTEFTNRKKMGFTPPLENWLLDYSNQKWILEHLKNKNLIVRSLFSEKAINKLFQNDTFLISNKLRIYRLLFLNRWFEKVYL
jgi:asparagine synthase (glutamine-hydrolysing)